MVFGWLVGGSDIRVAVVPTGHADSFYDASVYIVLVTQLQLFFTSSAAKIIFRINVQLFS